MFLCVYVSANPPILLFDMHFPLLVCLPNIKIGKVRVLRGFKIEMSFLFSVTGMQIKNLKVVIFDIWLVIPFMNVLTVHLGLGLC